VIIQNVGLTLQHLLYALIVAVAAYIIREVRRWRMAIRPRRPELTIDQAWQMFSRNPAAGPDVRLIALPSADNVRQQAGRIAQEVEDASSASDNPRLIIRQGILANATTALQLAAIAEYDEEARQALIRGYERGMDALLKQAVSSCHLAWFVLRVYARWKFDDAVEDDWLHNYMNLARPYSREKVRLAKEHVIQMDASAARFAEIYDALLAELQEKMIKARPKQRFVRPDLPL